MILNISSYRFNNFNQNYTNENKASAILPKAQCTNFRGMSCASAYKSSFDFLAAKILKSNKKLGIDGSLLSATKIKLALERIFQSNKIFNQYAEASITKINWRNYIPQDVREYCVNKINSARAARLKEWQTFLEDPESIDKKQEFPRLVNDIKCDPALKLVIWNSVISELTPNNRHIPVPFDLIALDETVQFFKKIQPKFRAVTCATTSFLDMYTHRLRDNLLIKKGFAKQQDVWVKIPSAKHDPENLEENISVLEILSNKNWCTRSSVDKAADALADGDFYLYLRRDSRQVWQSLLGMTSCRGKIDQIQGRENNNFIPPTEVENVKAFIEESGLQCHSGVYDEGPKAIQQILIAEKMNEVNPTIGKSLADAIKEKDDKTILHIIGQKIKYTPEGKFEIDTYKPQFLLRNKGGIIVPYSFMGIDENIILNNVERINGDLILYNTKNKIFSSTITEFPPNLKEVTGRIVCNKKQYEMFKDDIHRVAKNEVMIKIHNT